MLYQFFSRTKTLQLNLLILLKFPDIFHWKSAKKFKLVDAKVENVNQIVSHILKNSSKNIAVKW